MKVGVADYGMNKWAGGLFDIEERLLALKDIGFDGTERLVAVSPSDALHKAGLYRRLGMDFSTCCGPDIQANIEWTAALGKSYVWMTPGDVSRKAPLDVFCRRANVLARSCRRWGLTAAIHNHMFQRVESQQELEEFLQAVPDAGMVLDTAHLSMAGGDPVSIVRKYHKRITVMHLKDVFLTGKTRNDGRPDYRFCELGAGNNGFDNAQVLRALREIGWDGWLYVEHDEHLRDPLEDLRVSREFIRRAIGV